MRKLAALLAVVLMAGLLAPLPGSQAAQSALSIRWQPCHAKAGRNFECATVWLPLDHDSPSGAKISLALVRLPASDPDAKIGSIFLNPGGPGGSGVDLVLEVGPLLFSKKVRARFDLVGFDPRGIIRSSPLLCFRSLKGASKTFPPFAFPVTSEEEAIVEQLDMALSSACQRHGGPIVDHMATADVARDLDLLRRAVGDEQLTYVGYSYGSFLGVTYANLFPDRVRAVVVDGVLDPIAWTTGRGEEALTLPLSTRLRSDASARDTLNEFFRLCDQAGLERCALAGNAGGRFAALAERLRAVPLEIVDPETGKTVLFTYADIIGIALFVMYSSAVWPLFAEFLAEIEALASPPALGDALRAVEERTGLAARRERPDRYPNFVEGSNAVACSDSDNPDLHHYWSVAGAQADQQFGYFGRPWTWISSACAVWRGFDDDRYLGPFDSTTANPVLVVGNRFDPATPYEGALIVNELLPNSSLLTLEGWGHTSLFLSLCADRVVSRYLLEGTTPPAGTTCAQDVAPFESMEGGARDRFAKRQAARAEVMSEMAT